MSYKEYIVKVYESGAKEWYLNGKLHREDGPAYEYADGNKNWFLNGKLHRVDGPAVEYISGTKLWYLNGKRHREDGPAIERGNGEKYWYLNGKELTEQEFKDRMNNKNACDGKIVEIDGVKYQLTIVE